MLTKIFFFAFIFILACAGYVCILTAYGATFGLEKYDTIEFSIVGFGAMLVLGQICFSWSRSLPEVHEKMREKLNKIGRESTVPAVAFLFSALAKLDVTQKTVVTIAFEDVVKGINSFTYFITFAGAIVVSMYLVIKIAYYSIRLRKI